MCTLGQFSHAMICIEPPIFTEAEGNGVFNVDLSNFYVHRYYNVKILRLKAEHGGDRIAKKAANFAMSRFGSRYSIRKAITSIFPFINPDENPTTFCSMLV